MTNRSFVFYINLNSLNKWKFILHRIRNIGHLTCIRIELCCKTWFESHFDVNLFFNKMSFWSHCQEVKFSRLRYIEFFTVQKKKTFQAFLIPLIFAFCFCFVLFCFVFVCVLPNMFTKISERKQISWNMKLVTFLMYRIFIFYILIGYRIDLIVFDTMVFIKI